MAASTYLAQVQQLYISYFGRPADPIGQAYWAGIIDAAGGNIAAVQAGFSASTESQALYGNKSTIDKVTAIYLNDFNRTPDAAGLAYWVAQIDSGKVTQAQAAWTIQQSAGAGDAATVQNKLTAATAFTAAITTSAQITGYQGTNAAASARSFLNTITSDNATATAAVAGAAAAVSAAVAVGGSVGTSYALTAGIDALVGTSGNDTFTGVSDGTTATLTTLSAGDSIDGGAGNDTLKVVVANTAGANTQLAGVTIKNVENIAVQNVAAGATTVNLAPIAGVNTVTSLNSTGAVTFQNLATGTEVVVSGSAQTGQVNFNQATATDAVKVTFTGGVNGVAALASAGSATSAALNSTGAANGTTTANTVALTGNVVVGAGTLTTLAVNADTALRATLTATDFVTTGAALTVTGAGAVNLGTAGVFKTINAAGNTGGLTVGVSSVTTTFTGGSGNDVVTGTAVAAGAVIDGGAGIDTVQASLITAGNSASFKNFEVLELAGSGLTASSTLDAALLTGSTISAVSISGAFGSTAGGPGPSPTTATINNLVETAAGFTVNVTGSGANAATLGFTAASVAGTADVLNYNFTGANGAGNVNAGTITTQGIETINISSKGGTGVTNTLAVVDNAAKSIVITGDHALNLSVAAQSGATSALTSVDASAATAGVTITTNAALKADGTAGGVQSALTVKGSAFADTITVVTSAGTASVGATVTTGAGNDTVNVTGATAQAGFNQFTTITDFAKGDKLVFTAGATIAKIDVSSASSLTAAEALATANATITTNWFNYGGDTYVVNNADGAVGVSATDVVVKLTGTLDLSTSTVAAGVLTFA